MSQANALELQMLELINEERAAVGADPLVLDLRLNTSSETHSEWMLDEDVFSHTGSDNSSAGDRMSDAGFKFSGSWSWGENIAYQSERGKAGYSDDVVDLHESLMNSQGHRENILSDNFEAIGIGIEIGDYNGYEAVMVTQNFATTGAALQIDPGDTADTNEAPVARLGKIFVAEDTWRTIGQKVTYRDADKDAAVEFEVMDAKGGNSLRIDGQVVDAQDGFVFDADQLASLAVLGGEPGSAEALRIRASDGEDWGEWDTFVLRTTVTNVASAADTLAISLTDGDAIA